MSAIAFRAVHDAIDAGEALDPATLAARVWDRFEDTADTSRQRKDGRTPWSPADAARKVADKLRLHRQGRLPGRSDPDVRAAFELPTMSVDEAREALDARLEAACARIQAWRRDEAARAPRIGVRATVGLGKSARARTHVLDLQRRLRADGLAHKVIVLTPSHALAEETAANWAADGADVAVMRGYHAKDPATGRPMCLDIEAVDAAILAGEKVHETACASRKGRCPLFDACAKQRNKTQVSEADVVVAAYDALFTGFTVKRSEVALILIDEAVWPRAIRQTVGIVLETLAEDELRGGRGRSAKAKERDGARLADLIDLRRRALRALSSCAPGAARRSALVAEGLTAEDCRAAAGLEERSLRDTGPCPGLPPKLRGPAIGIAKRDARIRRRMTLRHALAGLLEGREDADGRVQIRPPIRRRGCTRSS